MSRYIERIYENILEKNIFHLKRQTQLKSKDSVLSVDALLNTSAYEKDNGPTGDKISSAIPLDDLILSLSSIELE